jgi:hypothetical protein
MITGCAPRLKTHTLSAASTATLVASTNDQPSGNRPQPSIGLYRMAINTPS